MKLQITGAQLPITRDIAKNVAEIESAIEVAAAQKADILLTPEGSLSGYTPDFDTQTVAEALEYITAKAKAARIGLALGTCFIEPADGNCYNQLRFYTPEGNYLGFHSKTLTCGTLTDPPEGEINDYAVRPVRTFTFQGITIGGLICNDLWANPECTPIPDPHLTQQLAQMGARIIFHAVNGGRDGGEWSEVAWRYHESNLRMRARAGRLWIVTVDNCYPPHIPCSAPSGIVDPKGNWVCHTASKGKAYFIYTLEL